MKFTRTDSQLTPCTCRVLMLAAFAWLLIGALPASASEMIEVFTEPYRTIELAASEQGTLYTVEVQQGEIVRAGEPVAALNHDVLTASLAVAKLRAQMTAPVKRAIAEVRQKQRRYEKIMQLHQNKHASAEEFDSAKTALEIAQADLLDAKERQQLAQLQVEEIASQLRRRKIFSPVSGQVVELHKEVGEYVASLEPVVATIVQLDRLRVKFYVDTQLARSIKPGDQIPLIFQDTNQQATGVVEFVSPTTDADSSTVRVEVVIDNRDGSYRSGVSVRFATSASAKSGSSLRR